MGVEKVKQGFALGVSQAKDVPGIAWVYEEGFPLGFRVDCYDGMLCTTKLGDDLVGSFIPHRPTHLELEFRSQVMKGRQTLEVRAQGF